MRLFAIAVMVVSGVLAGSASAANPQSGRMIAQTWCANCHVVGPEGTGTDAAPAFTEIAADPNRSPSWVRNWLSTEHPNMPDFNLTRDEIEDVIAYLQSLGRN